MLSFLFATVLITTVLASPAQAPVAGRVREVASFPLGAWLENIAVRHNGRLLVTRLDVPEVWSVDAASGREKLVARFPAATSALGITEVEHDVFAVAIGNFSIATSSPTPGTYSIWCLDARTAKTHKVADVPQAAFIDGLTTLSDSSVLAADSALGVVYRVDLRTGKSPVVLSGTPYEAPPAPAIPLGVNGIRTHDSSLYFTNAGAGTFARVAIHKNGTAAGEVETIAQNLEFPDDFAFSPSGKVSYLAVNQVRSVVAISLADGNRTQIAGGSNSTEFATPTAVQFGRTVHDRKTLYVTTGGERDATGAAVTSGKVIAVTTA